MRDLILLNSFKKSYKKIVKNNRKLKIKVEKTLNLLKTNFSYPSLRTHKANTIKYGLKFSSSVTDDIRIIWDFDKNNNLVIRALDIGKHSGKFRIYK